jgi:hypothetical protein
MAGIIPLLCRRNDAKGCSQAELSIKLPLEIMEEALTHNAGGSNSQDELSGMRADDYFDQT